VTHTITTVTFAALVRVPGLTMRVAA
jgi:hypothetical protein